MFGWVLYRAITQQKTESTPGATGARKKRGCLEMTPKMYVET